MMSLSKRKVGDRTVGVLKVVFFLFTISGLCLLYSCGEFSQSSQPTEQPPEVNPCLNVSQISAPNDLATGMDVSESDDGWGGGSYKTEIIDGLRTYGDWAHGLAFCGGVQRWCDQPCGWHQATINFGKPTTFNKVIVWHHGIEHVPNVYKIQYWDETSNQWIDIFSTTQGKGYLMCGPNMPNWPIPSLPTVNTFKSVTSTKVRFTLNNCDITHGWIYEFEVYNE
jgi:hypothetical protein